MRDEYEQRVEIQTARGVVSNRRRKKKETRVKSSAGAPSKEQQEAMLCQVADVVGAIIGDDVGQDVPLMDAGLDSLGAVELRNALAQAVGMELPGTFVFDYPSVGALAGYLGSQAVPTADGDEEVSCTEQDYSLSTGSETTLEVMIYSALCDSSAGAIGVQLDNKQAVDGLGTIP